MGERNGLEKPSASDSGSCQFHFQADKWIKVPPSHEEVRIKSPAS